MSIEDWGARPWGEPWSDVPAVASEASKVDEIGLARGMCCGPCPAYSLRLERSGKATFDGDHFVNMLGRWEASISPEDVQILALAMVYAGFDQLAPNYAVDYTDAASTRTWLVTGTERVDVDDYGGAGPQQLRTIEDLVDAAGADLHWLPTEAATHDRPEGQLFAGLDVSEEWRPASDPRAKPHWTQARRSQG